MKRYRLIDADTGEHLDADDFVSLYEQLKEKLDEVQTLRLENLRLRTELALPTVTQEYLCKKVITTSHESLSLSFKLHVIENKEYIPYDLSVEDNIPEAGREAIKNAGGVRKVASVLGVTHTTVSNFSRNPEAIKFIVAEQLKILGIDPWVFYSEETKNNLKLFKRKYSK